jgi:hypothetical protein
MFTRDQFTLFFSMPLDETDWANLLTSGCKQVMMPWAFLTNSTLDALAKHDITLVARMSNATASTEDLGALQARMMEIKARIHCRAVILGCEPDVNFSWLYNADWGTDSYAWQHADRIHTLVSALHGYGPAIISPAWAQREGIVETDPPVPGMMAWREITRDAYNACDGNGTHLYGFGWWEPLNIARFFSQVRWFQTLHHQPLWIDEYNIVYGNQTTRMAACIATAQALIQQPGLAERVEMFCPFVSNGAPSGQWDAGLVMKDPACYTLLQKWLAPDAPRKLSGKQAPPDAPWLSAPEDHTAYHWHHGDFNIGL